MHAYIANTGDTKVILCDITQNSTGALVNCRVTNGEFRGTGNVGLNNSGTFAFVSNQILNTVFVCQVTQPNGELSDFDILFGMNAEDSYHFQTKLTE